VSLQNDVRTQKGKSISCDKQYLIFSYLDLVQTITMTIKDEKKHGGVGKFISVNMEEKPIRFLIHKDIYP